MTSDVQTYLAEGCGRCAYGGTPHCKVHTWTKELKLLRRIVLECGLNETVKWGVPCYTNGKSNIVVVAAFKNYCSLSFFKGSLLKDDAGLLTKHGENSQAGRFFKFTSVSEIVKLEPVIKAYIFEAIEVEKAGLKVAKAPEMPLPDELVEMFTKDKSFKAAFYALSPGRQRGYIIYFSAAKQSSTRQSRIEKYIPVIFSGNGIND